MKQGVHNTIYVRGLEMDVKDFLLDTIRLTNEAVMRKQAEKIYHGGEHIINCNEFLYDSVNNIINNIFSPENINGCIRLSTYFPIPSSYLLYDTNYYPYAKYLTVGQPIVDLLNNQHLIVTDELISKYKEVSQEQEEKYDAVGWRDYNQKYFGVPFDDYLEEWEITNNPSKKENEADINFSIYTLHKTPEVFLSSLGKKYPNLYFLIKSSINSGEFCKEFLYHGDDFLVNDIAYNEDELKPTLKEIEDLCEKLTDDIKYLPELEVAKDKLSKFFHDGNRESSLFKNWQAGKFDGKINKK